MSPFWCDWTMKPSLPSELPPFLWLSSGPPGHPRVCEHGKADKTKCSVVGTGLTNLPSFAVLDRKMTAFSCTLSRLLPPKYSIKVLQHGVLGALSYCLIIILSLLFLSLFNSSLPTLSPWLCLPLVSASSSIVNTIPMVQGCHDYGLWGGWEGQLISPPVRLRDKQQRRCGKNNITNWIVSDNEQNQNMPQVYEIKLQPHMIVMM